VRIRVPRLRKLAAVRRTQGASPTTLNPNG
jgi:hypothetical protein